jgi:hypothetical protein
MSEILQLHPDVIAFRSVAFHRGFSRDLFEFVPSAWTFERFCIQYLKVEKDFGCVRMTYDL